MSIQTKILNECRTELLAYSEQMKQSARHLKQLEQLNQAPYIYFLALNEIMRREKFSRVYKQVN